MRATAANLLWAGGSLQARWRHRQALRRPFLTQTRLLVRYLRANRDTSFGQSRAFAKVLASARVGSGALTGAAARALATEYQARVPVATYDDLAPFIDRIRAGEPSVLTRSRVERLVPSSGSTAAVKLLPSTREGQGEFSRAVDAWIADLFLHHPSLVGGRAYWSISPALPADRSGAVPVGYDHDSAYLGIVRQTLARAALAVPDVVSGVHDGDAFRYVTLLFLVHARDLRLISIWHPTFLGRLLDGLPEWLDRLAADVSQGRLSPPVRSMAPCARNLNAH